MKNKYLEIAVKGYTSIEYFNFNYYAEFFKQQILKIKNISSRSQIPSKVISVTLINIFIRR